ncbi:MAG: response regulator [Armatimonadetes bacterium]|nr:response regulator [Armatimonadota bacterium]
MNDSPQSIYKHLAHKALESGAQDFLVKGEIDRHVLLRSMRYAVERHQYQLALAQSESRLRSIIEVNADALLLIDDESRIVFANPAAEVLLGLPAQELVGQPFRHPLQPGATARLQLVAHDGTRRITEITAAEAEYGGRHAILASIRDVTEQVGAQSERLKNQQIEMMAVLAGGLAHDFNNFLTTVSLNLHLVKRRSNNVDTVAIIEDIERALGRARDLTQQFLTFSKSGAPVLKTTCVSHLIRESASFAVRGSNVLCRFDLPEDLWSAAIDDAQISQVLNNAIINAEQSMPHGGCITVRAHNVDLAARMDELPPGRYVCVSIEDEGTGMSPETQERIFQPYFTTKKKGAGLGLASAKSIIRSHGGAIKVESHEGEGSRFDIYLPASVNRPEEEPEPDDERTGRGRVLVMDDDDQIRKALSPVLHELGYESQFASDGSEAIDAFQRAREDAVPFDAVIMDLTVPGGMGGREALRHLLALDPQVKVIASSAYANDDVARNPTAYRFTAFLRKPYSVPELSVTLSTVCS